MRSRDAGAKLAAHLDVHHSAADGSRRRRYQPTAIYLLAERLKRHGVRLRAMGGPWRPDRRQLDRPGRDDLNAIPVVTNGRVEVMVDTMEHAVDLSGLLNWAGVDDLTPVPDLEPPAPVSSGGESERGPK
jgi:hypothetical protein